MVSALEFRSEGSWLEAPSLPSRGFLTPLCLSPPRCINRSWGPFLESPDNFSGPENYFMCAMFAFKTQILLVLKAEQ